jgi:hypothetical protein
MGKSIVLTRISKIITLFVWLIKPANKSATNNQSPINLRLDR